MASGGVEYLVAVFNQTISPDSATIKKAENDLKQASTQPGFGIHALQVVALETVDATVRLAAAVSFKNHVKYHWVISDADAYSGKSPIDDAEKGQIKTHLTVLMLRTPSRIRAQLSEALTIISQHDFPARWQTLLPELAQTLKTTDLDTINGVLETANSIFKRYRNQYSNDAMINELDASQRLFVPPLMEVFKQLSASIPQVQADIPRLKLLMSCVRLICRIFYSLNSPGLTPTFEESLDFWMSEFSMYLKFENLALAESDPEKVSILDGVKAAVCQNITLFMEMNEEEFAKYLKDFATDVWGLLVKVTINPGQDQLAMAALKFLSTVARSVHSGLFEDVTVLKQICENIVIPNLRVRGDEEELFEDNYLEYIRRDAEGSDADTRRRAAADLIRTLMEKFPKPITELSQHYVAAMLQEYSQNPASNWKAKHCAIYLVLALSIKGKTGAQGATSVNEFNIVDFFQSQIVPELQAKGVNDNPILKADAIKFVTTFRWLLPKEAGIALFPAFIQLLGSDSNVVHSYAATAVERFLSVKDNGKLRFTPEDVAGHLQALLTALFAAFQKDDSSENEYVMKAVVRVISFVGPGIAPVAADCLRGLAQMLLEVCKNPKYPSFNHYLFESVAALIRHGSAADINMVPTFEEAILPAFQLVLQQDVQEFHPYVFQIFSQLIELRTPPLPQVYTVLFPGLLAPVFWERSGNVPALVRLMQAYIAKNPGLFSGTYLEGVLGIFQKLNSSKAHDHEGFAMLTSMVEGLPLASYSNYMPTVWQLLFARLQTAKTPKYTRGFMTFFGRFIICHGPDITLQQVDQIQAGMFAMLIQQVWLANLSSVTDRIGFKVVTVATCKLLTDCSSLKQNRELWTALRQALFANLQGTAEAAPSSLNDDDDIDLEEQQGYTAAYAKLANAYRQEADPLEKIADIRAYAEGTVAQL